MWDPSTETSTDYQIVTKVMVTQTVSKQQPDTLVNVRANLFLDLTPQHTTKTYICRVKKKEKKEKKGVLRLQSEAILK
jgi:hypothetical protein